MGCDSTYSDCLGLAFLCARLVDIKVFDRLRHQRWWHAPLLGGVAGAVLDTFVFFSVAFAGTGVHWVALLIGDLAVKLVVNATMLVPFRALMWNRARPSEISAGRSAAQGERNPDFLPRFTLVKAQA